MEGNVGWIRFEDVELVEYKSFSPFPSERDESKSIPWFGRKGVRHYCRLPRPSFKQFPIPCL